MTDTEVRNLFLTRDEAVKYLVKNYRKGVSYRVCTHPFVYSKTPDECAESENPRGYEMYASVLVSQKQAVGFVKDVISDLFAERGVKIRVSDHRPRTSEFTGTTYAGCIFIG